ncbi:hypothetical protein SSTU70S_04091 [Stutzerimonas stutzeri]
MKLPLFPLDTVLFSGCTLDLQVFEPRYLDMLSGCLKAGHGFGVVHILEGSEAGPAPAAFARIGCEALIRDWQQQPERPAGHSRRGRAALLRGVFRGPARSARHRRRALAG